MGIECWFQLLWAKKKLNNLNRLILYSGFRTCSFTLNNFKEGREKRHFFGCQTSFLSGSEANLALHQSSEDNLRVDPVSLPKNSCHLRVCTREVTTSTFNQTLRKTFRPCGYISDGRSAVATATCLHQQKGDVYMGSMCVPCVWPVSAPARSPLPEPRERRGWPGSRRCWPSVWSRWAVCAGSGRPPSSPAPRRTSTPTCTKAEGL